MKQFVLILLTLLPFSLLSQSGLTVTSDNENVRFYLLLEGQQVNDFWETHVEVKGLKPGYYMVKLVFEGDSVADAWRNVLVKNGKMKVVKAVAKTDGQQKTGKSGRKIGKGLKIGSHDEEMDYLKDLYKLTIKEEIACTDCTKESMSVSVEKSLSSSAVPASKNKH